MGVLEAYQKAIHGTKLAGPTYFSEILGKVIQETTENVTRNGLHKNRIYSVLIVITDGNCHDMEITKKVMVDCATMPFSCVVVGVGESDFLDM